MAGSILGTRVLRTEDPQLLTGGARYLDDLDLPGKLHAVFARSEVAHAGLRRRPRRRRPRRAGRRRRLHGRRPRRRPPPRLRQGRTRTSPVRRWPTASCASSARPIALVVAETAAAAADGAAAVWADYEPLPAITDPEAALATTAPADLPRATAPTWRSSSPTPIGVDPADGSDVVVRGRYVNQRMAVVPMEPNSCAAVPGEPTSLTFYALDADAARRCGRSSPAPSGSTRTRSGSSPRRSVAASAARPGSTPSTRPWSPPLGCLDRPVTWTPARSDDLRRSRTVAARSSTPSSAAAATARSPGCASTSSATVAPTRGIGTFLPTGHEAHGQRARIASRRIQFDVAVAVTNTTPMGAYRGAGRPEATALLERLVDHAALELDIDPIELRRRNLLDRRRLPVHAR